ncbi:MAG: hypothetical protein GEU80_16395 [Dehalococcoidia bacterium]|nr:hypothetical protein [Dehalococcoidia bacterium]
MLKASLSMFLAAGVIASFGALESIAVFSGQAVNPGNEFTTGTVLLNDGPDSAVVTISDMAPGDLTIQPLTISNTGSLTLRYAMTTSATDVDAKGLRDQLELTVRAKTLADCDVEDGAVLYGPAPLSGGAFGSTAQGADPGDRELNAGTNETLCFKVELPVATGNAFQDATTEATFTFDAEQTVNNN